MSHEDRDALARLIIYMCAVVAWALSGCDQEIFKKVKQQGEMKWSEITGG